jgi:hypothetical protein
MLASAVFITHFKENYATKLSAQDICIKGFTIQGCFVIRRRGIRKTQIQLDFIK